MTIRIRLLLQLIIVALVVTPAAARSGADLATTVAALEQGYALLTDLQANFSQKTMIASLKREERGSGEMSLKKPANGSALFRFNYTKPRQMIISNGKTVWYYLPENKQVMVGDVASMFSSGNGVALNYLAGMGRVSLDFSIAFAGDGRDRKGNYFLELIPKKPNQMMEKLQLTLSAEAVDRFSKTGVAEEPFPIVSSVVYDAFGNRTTIEFSKVKTNRGIANDRFTFKVPAGVEVIKNK